MICLLDKLGYKWLIEFIHWVFISKKPLEKNQKHVQKISWNKNKHVCMLVWLRDFLKSRKLVNHCINEQAIFTHYHRAVHTYRTHAVLTSLNRSSLLCWLNKFIFLTATISLVDTL